MPVTPGQKGEQGAKLKFCLAPEKINSVADLNKSSVVYFEAGRRV